MGAAPSTSTGLSSAKLSVASLAHSQNQFGDGESKHSIGATSSLGGDSHNRILDDTALVSKLLLPIYYIDEVLNDVEKEKAIKSWKLIAGGRAEEFLRLKKLNPDMPEATSVDYFGNVFCERFMEVHPMSKSMFTKSAKKQGSLFFRMISFTISSLDDGDKFEKTFLTMANSHNRIGVRAVEYGIFGEVLFFTLRKTLGDDAYDADLHLCWVKIISRILRVMVPCAVKYEIHELANTGELSSSARSSNRSGWHKVEDKPFDTGATGNLKSVMIQ